MPFIIISQFLIKTKKKDFIILSAQYFIIYEQHDLSHCLYFQIDISSKHDSFLTSPFKSPGKLSDFDV